MGELTNRVPCALRYLFAIRLVCVFFPAFFTIAGLAVAAAVADTKGAIGGDVICRSGRDG